MIPHDDVAEHLPAIAYDGSLESVDWPTSVLIVANDLLAAVSPRHHVIDGPFEFNSQASWYGGRFRGQETPRQAKNQKQRPTPRSRLAYGPRRMARRSRLCVIICTRSSGPWGRDQCDQGSV